jgi:hypothetical protein
MTDEAPLPLDQRTRQDATSKQTQIHGGSPPIQFLNSNEFTKGFTTFYNIIFQLEDTSSKKPSQRF